MYLRMALVECHPPSLLLVVRSSQLWRSLFIFCQCVASVMLMENYHLVCVCVFVYVYLCVGRHSSGVAVDCVGNLLLYGGYLDWDIYGDIFSFSTTTIQWKYMAGNSTIGVLPDFTAGQGK